MAPKYEFCTSSNLSSDQISFFVFHYTFNLEKPPEISLADQDFLHIDCFQPWTTATSAITPQNGTIHFVWWMEGEWRGGCQRAAGIGISSWKTWRRGYRDGLIGRFRCMAIGDYLPDWGSGYYLTCRDQYPKSHKRWQHSISQELWCDVTVRNGTIILARPVSSRLYWPWRRHDTVVTLPCLEWDGPHPYYRLPAFPFFYLKFSAPKAIFFSNP